MNASASSTFCGARSALLRPLERLGVGPVRAERVVQAGAAGHEPLGLGVVDAAHQPHELAHDVAVEPRRPERVLADQPARREGHEVGVGQAGGVGGRRQHGEDRRIGVVVADRADHHEVGQVVLVRHVVAVPAHHVERGMVVLRRPQVAAELLHHLDGPPDLLVGRGRGEEIPLVRQPVRADRAALGQGEAGPVVLADVPACERVRQLDPEPDAPRDHRELAGGHVQQAELGAQQQAPGFRHDQQFAVRVDEVAVHHRRAGRVPVNPDPGVAERVAVAADRVQAVDEVGARGRDVRRVPAHPVGIRLDLTERRAAQQAVVDSPERRVRGRRDDAVDPGAPVHRPGLGERGAADLLGVQPERCSLRRVAAGWQRPGHRLAHVLVTKPPQIRQRRHNPALRYHLSCTTTISCPILSRFRAR